MSRVIRKGKLPAPFKLESEEGIITSSTTNSIKKEVVNIEKPTIQEPPPPLPPPVPIVSKIEDLDITARRKAIQAKLAERNKNKTNIVDPKKEDEEEKEDKKKQEENEIKRIALMTR